MTKEKYKRAKEIDDELHLLKLLQRELEGNATLAIKIGTSCVKHNGLHQLVKDYVYNRIKELTKEFEKL